MRRWHERETEKPSRGWFPLRGISSGKEEEPEEENPAAQTVWTLPCTGWERGRTAGASAEGPSLRRNKVTGHERQGKPQE